MSNSLIKSHFYNALPNQFYQEKILYESPESKPIELKESQSQLESKNLRIRITSHRIVIYSPDNPRSFCELLLKQLDKREKIKQGFFRQFVGIKLVRKDQKQCEIYGDDVNAIYEKIKEAQNLNKSIQETILQATNANTQNAPNIGLQHLKKGENQGLAVQENLVGSSFRTNDLKELIKKADELKSISLSLNNNLQKTETAEDKNLAEKLLKNKDFCNIVTKENQDYVVAMAKKLVLICQERFPSSGWIINILDLYNIYNQSQTTSPASPEEFMEALTKFSEIGFKAKVVTYDNCKVIESTDKSSEVESEQWLSQYFSYEKGISPFELAKKCKISPLVAEIKLEQLAKKGKLAKDDRIEGKRFFKNLILGIKPNNQKL